MGRLLAATRQAGPVSQLAVGLGMARTCAKPQVRMGAFGPVERVTCGQPGRRRPQ
jgi:hypothetical protein